MAIFYVLGCIIILVLNASYVIPAFVAIVKHAFTPQAAGGGSDAANALMAIPNVFALLLLSGVIVDETRKYLGSNNIDLVSEDFLEQDNTPTKTSRPQCASQKQ